MPAARDGSRSGGAKQFVDDVVTELEVRPKRCVDVAKLSDAERESVAAKQHRRPRVAVADVERGRATVLVGTVALSIVRAGDMIGLVRQVTVFEQVQAVFDRLGRTGKQRGRERQTQETKNSNHGPNLTIEMPAIKKVVPAPPGPNRIRASAMADYQWVGR